MSDTVKVIRQRLGLKADDERRDRDIAAMNPIERFRHVCGWHLGDPHWADTMISWAKDCGIEIGKASS
jgi:lactam utilization protein B